MMKSKRFAIASTAIFVAVEALLGWLLQVNTWGLTAHFAFSSIILACVFFALFAERTADYALTQSALVCTVCADYFLVWCYPRVQLPAMCFFLVAQTCYAVRIYLCESNEKKKRWQIVAHVCLSVVAVALTAAVLKQGTDALALVSMLYYANLLANIVFAFTDIKRHALLAVGMLLFICCDTLVGFAQLDAYLPINEEWFIYKIMHPGFDLAWACYLPSQVLITLSLFPSRWKKLR